MCPGFWVHIRTSGIFYNTNNNTKTIKTIEGNSKNQVVERTYTVDKNGVIRSEGYGDGRQVVGFADFIS